MANSVIGFAQIQENHSYFVLIVESLVNFVSEVNQLVYCSVVFLESRVFSGNNLNLS